MVFLLLQRLDDLGQFLIVILGDCKQDFVDGFDWVFAHNANNLFIFFNFREEQVFEFTEDY